MKEMYAEGLYEKKEVREVRSRHLVSYSKIKLFYVNFIEKLILL